MKLYLMYRLQTETDEDMLQIAELAKRVIEVGREVNAHGHPLHSEHQGFVPKARAFPVAAQLDHETSDALLAKLRDALRSDPR